MTPPLLLISSIVISATSFSDVSEIAIVPDNEWRIPTLIGSLDSALVNDGAAVIARHAVSERIFRSLRLFMRMSAGGFTGFSGNDSVASVMPARILLFSARRLATLCAGLQLINFRCCTDFDSCILNGRFSPIEMVIRMTLKGHASA